MDLDNIQDIELLRSICKKYMIQMKKDYIYKEPFGDLEYVFKKGFWYPFLQSRYGVTLYSGDESRVEENFTFSKAKEYFEKWS